MANRLFHTAAGVIISAAFSWEASAITVTSFDPAYVASGQWFIDDTRPGGVSEIKDLTGMGGNLENNAPLPTGAAHLTTNLTNNAKAQVSVVDSFGTMGDFISGGSLSYDFYKAQVAGGNIHAAAAIKLTISDFTDISGDGFGTFVFEPYVNASAGPPVTDTWLSEMLTGTTGNVWHTGLYGDPNQAGGPSQSLTAWLAHFGNTLLDAQIVALSVGVGSYNQGQNAYFDNISFSNGAKKVNYDFQGMRAVPLPAALPLFGTGLAVLGFVGFRRKKRIATRT